jgi:RNase H
MSNSQAALRALKSYSFTSKLVADCLDNLKRLITKCKLTLMWVPSHTGVDGNEEADQLANKGSETHFIGPEPFFGYSSMKYKTDLNEWIEQRKMEHFSDLPSDSLAKRFQSYSNKRTEQILNLTKTEIKTLTGILTD